VIPSIARSGNFSATVENELNRKVNVGTFGVACNLDSICQGAQGPMCPTRATILRQVLVEGMGQIRNSVHVYGKNNVLVSAKVNSFRCPFHSIPPRSTHLPK